MTKLQVLGTLMLLLLHFRSGSTTGNTFQLLDGCVCPGYNITFECTTVGRGITVWQGTAFDCPLSSNEIQLRHTQFLGSIGVCNNGDICAHAISILSPDCFVSHLSIKVNYALEGRTVICEHDDGDTVNPVNSSILTITKDPIAGPMNISLVGVGPGLLTFMWSSILPNCDVLSYVIDSTNCGQCPAVSDSLTASCHDVHVSALRSVCRFSVRSVVCGNITGTTRSESLVTLGVQHAPIIVNSTAIYSINNTLTKIILNLRLPSEEFKISESISGGVKFIKVNYSDSANDNTCSSAMIPSTSCTDGLCHHEFDTTASFCGSNTSIKITTSSLNVLGEGPHSDPFIRDHNNTLVKIEARSDSIVCLFLIQKNEQKSCSIKYGPTCHQLYPEQLSGRIDDGKMVEINLIQKADKYCYIVLATSGNTVVNFTGTFLKPNEDANNTLVPVVSVISIIAVFCILLLLILFSVTYYNKSGRHINYRVTKCANEGFQLESINIKSEEGEALLEPTLKQLLQLSTIQDDTKQKLNETNKQEPEDSEPTYAITFLELQWLNTGAD